METSQTWGTHHGTIQETRSVVFFWGGVHLSTIGTTIGTMITTIGTYYYRYYRNRS